ncbi:hypothetical protein [Acinetobacter sp. GN11]
MSIKISVQVNQDSDPFLQFISGLVYTLTVLAHQFILLVEKYRFYDFPSINQAIGRIVIK